jgi:hypothetical protein
MGEAARQNAVRLQVQLILENTPIANLGVAGDILEYMQGMLVVIVSDVTTSVSLPLQELHRISLKALVIINRDHYPTGAWIPSLKGIQTRHALLSSTLNFDPPERPSLFENKVYL